MNSRSKFALSVALWAIAVTVALAFENHFPEGITYMSSPSLPEGWYETRPIGFPLKRGETVCAVYHQPAWAAGRHYLPNDSFICKHVFGLPGDRISAAVSFPLPFNPKIPISIESYPAAPVSPASLLRLVPPSAIGTEAT